MQQQYLMNYETTSTSSYSPQQPNDKQKRAYNTYVPQNNYQPQQRNQRQKMFSKPFSFKGRIRRLELFLSRIIGWAYALIVSPFNDATSEEVSLLFLILIIPYFWFNLAQGVKRCHDMNHNGWWQLIPFYELLMLFDDGDPFVNDYGPDPKGRDMNAGRY